MNIRAVEGGRLYVEFQLKVPVCPVCGQMLDGERGLCSCGYIEYSYSPVRQEGDDVASYPVFNGMVIEDAGRCLEGERYIVFRVYTGRAVTLELCEDLPVSSEDFREFLRQDVYRKYTGEKSGGRRTTFYVYSLGFKERLNLCRLKHRRILTSAFCAFLSEKKNREDRYG